MSSAAFVPQTSFRDPHGRLLVFPDSVIRVVRKSGVADLETFLNSAAARELVSTGRLVSTRVLDPAATERLCLSGTAREALEATDVGLVLEHERISFPTFPYEWPAEMLQAAALLTLDLAERLLPEQFCLKDGTPYNVLFRGPEPVFVDVLSIERRDPSDPTWLPYAQFMRTFVLPLLACQRLGLPFQPLLALRRDGLEPEEVYRLCGPVRRLLPPFLTLVSIPTWLGGRKASGDDALYRKRSLPDPHQARFILGSLIRQLRRTVVGLTPDPNRRSGWSDYHTSDNNYTPGSLRAKQAFVQEAMEEIRPRKVLDIGCNTGEFSMIAGRSGAEVVAIDNDPVVVGELWRQARRAQLAILPAVMDITRPSPAIGWRNGECPSFLERAGTHGFDLVMMLAVLHHLLVSENVPLPEILDLAADLTTRFLVMEFVPPDDCMFRAIVRGRGELFAELDRSVFERACTRRFDVVRCRHLAPSARWLYLLKKRQ
jgi:SAM-dependent methyltransferase